MSRRQNRKSPPTPLKSRAFVTRSFYRPAERVSPFRAQQAAVQKRRINNARFKHLRKTIQRSPQAKKLSLIGQAVHGYQQVNRCLSKWSRVLSWRADQKHSGKGGRKREPRSQREKAASQQKFFKYCN